MTTSSDIVFDQNTLIGNRYVIIRKIGQGGMGFIYLVQDRLVKNRILVLKTIRESVLSKKQSYVTNEFKNEYLVMTRLKHPNLARVYDFGQDEDSRVYYIAMEYLKGETLRSIIRKGQVSKKQAINIIVIILRTLEFIHSREIVYRDLKPENVVVDFDLGGNIRSLKLLDFGLADSFFNIDKTVKGTISYMAPEVFKKKGADWRCDIFAAGLIFYELLSGKFPYKYKDHKNIISSLSGSFEFYNNGNFNIESKDPVFNQIVKKMTAYNLEERFNSCIEVIEKLSTVYQGDFVFETKQTKDAYVSGINYVRRDGLGDFYEGILVSKKPKLYLLTGEMGYGKSTCMNELIKYCKINEISFFKNSEYDSDGDIFKPFSSILKKIIYRISQDELENFGRELRRIFPDFKEFSNYEQRDISDDESFKSVNIQVVSDFILSYLKKNSKDRIIFILDDLHKYDELSLEVIADLLYKLEYFKCNNVVLVASAARIRGEAEDLISKLEEKNRIKKFKLNLLSDNEVERFLQTIFGQKNVGKNLLKNTNKLNHRIGGIPLFLTEYIRSLVDKDQIIRKSNEWDLADKLNFIDLPITLNDVLKEKKNKLKLSKTEHELIILLIIFDRSFTLEHLLSLASSYENSVVFGFITKLLDNDLLSYNGKLYHLENELVYNSFYDEADKNLVLKMYLLILIKIHELCLNENSVVVKSRKEYFMLALYSRKFIRYIKSKSLIIPVDITLLQDMLESLGYAAEKLKKLYVHKESLKYFDLLRIIYDEGIRTNIGIKFKDKISSLQNAYECAVCLEKLGKFEKVREYLRLIDNYKKIRNDSFYKIYLKSLALLGNINIYQSAFIEAEKIMDKFGEIRKKYIEGETECDLNLYYLAAEIFFRKFNYRKALEYTEKMMKLSSGVRFFKYYLKGLDIAGKCHLALGDLMPAKQYFNEIYKLAHTQGNEVYVSVSTANLGSIYYNQGNTIEAEQFFQKFLNSAKKTGDIRNLMRAYLNLAVSVSEKKRKIQYNQTALRFAKELNDKSSYFLICNNLGSTYSVLHEYKNALRYYLISYKGFVSLDNLKGVLLSGSNLGDLYTRKGKFVRAQKFISNQIDCARKISNIRYLGLGLYYQAKLFYHQQLYDQALEEVERSIDQFMKYEIYNKLIRSINLKIEILYKQGKYQEALNAANNCDQFLSKISEEKILFRSRVLRLVLNFKTEQISKEQYFSDLNLMVKFEKDISSLAEIYFLMGEAINNSDYLQKSRDLYLILWSKSSFPEFKEKLEKIEMIQSSCVKD